MKYAFSTVSCPKWDFETIISRAREYGYGGIELRGFLNETVLTSSNPFLSDPKKVSDAFTRGGIQICCLSSSIAMAQHRKQDQQLAKDLTQYIDMAQALGSPYVKVFDTQVKPGQSRASAGVKLGDWLLPLGDYAADRDVVIVIENALSFRSAKELWTILDRLNHPSIACCWDVFNAAVLGESPWVSVPTLNSRIQYVQVKDAKIGALGASYCKIGEGDVPIKGLMTRLRGIGYDGWVSVEWEKAWLPNIAEPEDVLPDAIKKLKEWSGDQPEESAQSDAEPAAAKHGTAVA